VNVAVQFTADDIVTFPSLQSASPVQPLKIDPAAGVAVKATTAPEENAALHVAPQLIPAGLLVTVPLPLPALLIVSVKVGVNVAMQLTATDMITLPSLQSASPVQPAKADPADGDAVSVTVLPALNDALQVAPQLIPAGLLVTVPLPLPALVMLN
jgi:hypothetical protein